MRLTEILAESCVIADLKGKTKEDVLVELVAYLKKANLIDNADEVLRVILEREKLGSTGIGDGVAIPHGKMKRLDRILCVAARSLSGVDFDAVDRKLVHIFFLVLAPEDSASMHLKVLSRISKILRDKSFRKRLLKLGDARDLYTTLVEADSKIP